MKTFAQTDAQKNLHNYIAVIVDPVDIYLASDADGSRLPEKTRAAAANYFRAALTQAVFDAFPVVDQPGPLVLRLRSALIGVEAGKKGSEGDASESAANISKVGVEMELVDSADGRTDCSDGRSRTTRRGRGGRYRRHRPAGQVRRERVRHSTNGPAVSARF